MRHMIMMCVGPSAAAQTLSKTRYVAHEGGCLKKCRMYKISRFAENLD